MDSKIVYLFLCSGISGEMRPPGIPALKGALELLQFNIVGTASMEDTVPYGKTPPPTSTAEIMLSPSHAVGQFAKAQITARPIYDVSVYSAERVGISGFGKAVRYDFNEIQISTIIAKASSSNQELVYSVSFQYSGIRFTFGLMSDLLRK